jgi:hypothetical protein
LHGVGSAATWAAHPNAALRGRIAEYLGRGWKVDTIDERSATLSHRKAWTRWSRLFINPWYLLYLFRTDRLDRVRLTAEAEGVVREERIA